jgi:hypothetical protein
MSYVFLSAIPLPEIKTLTDFDIIKEDKKDKERVCWV